MSQPAQGSCLRSPALATAATAIMAMSFIMTIDRCSFVVQRVCESQYLSQNPRRVTRHVIRCPQQPQKVCGEMTVPTTVTTARMTNTTTNPTDAIQIRLVETMVDVRRTRVPQHRSFTWTKIEHAQGYTHYRNTQICAIGNCQILHTSYFLSDAAPLKR